MSINNSLKKNFSIVPNELILDRNISPKARFLFVWMASKPDDWNFYMDNMSKESGLSPDVVRKCIKELIKRGWLYQGKQKNTGKFGSIEYELFASPQFNDK